MDTSIPEKLKPADNQPLSINEQNHLLKQLPEWTIVDNKNINQLQRLFNFRNFVDALGFTNHVAELAEQADHHPTLTTEWGKVTVTWWTHRIKGLHLNDFVMARRTDQAYVSMQESKAGDA